VTTNPFSRLIRAGLLTGVTDGLFSSVLSVVFYHSTASRLFQGVAAVLLGQEAFNGGTATVALGVLMHFGVAFGWSALFLFLVMRSRWIHGLLASPYGVVKVASLYGPFIWMVMSLAVIPLLTHRPPTINNRWWIQFIGHFPFVGMDLDDSLRQYVEDRRRLVERLRRLSAEEWTRTADHGEYSHYSVFIMFRHVALHDFLHAYRIEELLLKKEWTPAL
jgi:hypothetical protein